MRSFPNDYDPQNVTLLCIPCSFFEIIAGKVSELEKREEWNTDADWSSGYQAILHIEECFVSCGQNILDRLDRLNAALGYNAGLPDDDPLYNAADTQKYHKEQLGAIATSIRDRMGYASGGDIETSLAAIEAKIEGASDEELAAILQAILAML